MQVVEAGTGRLLGTVDAGAAHTTVHEGAVHLHQGRTYLVRSLDLEDSVALVEQATPTYSTVARDTTAISVLETDTEIPWGDGRLCYGSVEVTNQVVSFLRRRLITGEVLGETKLDLPPRTLRTRAVWWTVTEDQLDAARINPEILGGALHAAEHASIGMLPLFATCDRWDIGGVSVPLHPDTLLPTVFVYDGHPGGAGFAERAFHTARAWLTATREAIASCECDAGCPSCIQSPKCGNGNDPLHKRGAVRLLTELLRGAPREDSERDSAEGREGAAPGQPGQPGQRRKGRGEEHSGASRRGRAEGAGRREHSRGSREGAQPVRGRNDSRTERWAAGGLRRRPPHRAEPTKAEPTRAASTRGAPAERESTSSRRPLRNGTLRSSPFRSSTRSKGPLRESPRGSGTLPDGPRGSGTLPGGPGGSVALRDGSRRRALRRGSRPRPDLRGEGPPTGSHRHVGDLAGERASDQPRLLGRRDPLRPGAGGRSAPSPVLRRRERRQIRSAGRTVPGHDRLAQGQHDTEHQAQNGDRADAPDSGRALVGARFPGPHGPPPAARSTDATASSRTSKGRPRSTGGSATTTTRNLSPSRLTETRAPRVPPPGRPPRPRRRGRGGPPHGRPSGPRPRTGSARPPGGAPTPVS